MPKQTAGHCETCTCIKKVPHECQTCCVVDQHCDRPAGTSCYYTECRDGSITTPCRPLPECYSCGQPVCRQCSSIRKYYTYGKVRLCNNCQTEQDGNSRRVLYRIARRSGYNHKAAQGIVRQREG